MNWGKKKSTYTYFFFYFIAATADRTGNTKLAASESTATSSAIKETVVSDAVFKKALARRDLKFAYELALEANSKEKWEKLAMKAIAKSQLALSQNCLNHLAGTDILFLKIIVCQIK